MTARTLDSGDLPRLAARTGIAAILAGSLIFAGQAGQIIFGSPGTPAEVMYGLLFAGGVLALGVAIWGLRDFASATRPGRIGVRLAFAGIVLLGLFVGQLLAEVVRTGELPENFALFGLGFLLMAVGQLLFARSLRYWLGRRWLLPIAAVVGVIVGLVVVSDPYHDIGLFVFEGAWIALGVGLLRLGQAAGHQAVPARHRAGRV